MKARGMLVALTLLATLGAAAWTLAWAFDSVEGCIPDAPRPVGTLRVMTSPDDGCGHWRMHRLVAGHSAFALGLAAAVAAVVLREPKRQRLIGAVALGLIGVLLVPVAAFWMLWNAECGPLESYLGSCTGPRWLYPPVLALALGIPLLAAARKPNSFARADA